MNHAMQKLLEYSKELRLLYVEDNEKARQFTYEFFSRLFKEVDTAENGREGLKRYNEQSYDLVVTDINMPEMDGIEMVRCIREINPDQKIIAISAHDEPEVLIPLIKSGVSSFMLKPIDHSEVIELLYPVCRDSFAQNLNLELVYQLNEERDKLKRQLRELEAKTHTIDTKHKQIEVLLQQKEGPKEPLMEAYFAKDEDEGSENVIFIPDHCDDLREVFSEIPELIARYSLHPDREELATISERLSKAASVLNYYAPYLDSLAENMHELSAAIREHMDSFTTLLNNGTGNLLALFDAVSTDMERYIERFSVESLAMKNAHHIHEPTSLSIRQIISMIVPEEMESGGLEFF